MFDRIAGVYDRMNSVMTAGLHHPWRHRAAELAALAPGDRALDVATGTGDLALELGQPRRRPTARSIGVDFSEQMLELARAKARGVDRPSRRAGRSVRAGQRAGAAVRGRRVRRRDGRLRRAQLLRPRARVCARWRASSGPAAGSSSSRSRPRRSPPLSTFFRLWFDRVVPVARAARGRRATPTATSRARSGGSPGRRSSPP